MNEKVQNSDTVQQIRTAASIPVDAAVCFSNHKNIYKPRIEKNQRKLLARLSFLRPFLMPDETIRLVTTGCSPFSFLEQFFGGAIMQVYKRALFVFTNFRVLHIPVKSDYAYRDSIAQILYGDCAELTIKGWTLVAKYADGTTEKFSCIRGKERKKIKALLKNLPADKLQSPEARRTHLCPRCTHRLIADQYVCPACELQFKSKAEARRISLIYPGGGYFYTRHYLLGVIDAIAEAWLSVLLIFALIDIFRNIPNSAFVALALALMLALEKTITIAHSNRSVEEYIPVPRRVQPNPALLTAAQQPPADEYPQQTAANTDDVNTNGELNRILRLS
jgi:hypothetical protein